MADLIPGVQWVDSGDAVARRVGSLLANGGPAEANKLDIEHQIFFTRNVPDTSGFKDTLSRLGFKRVKVSLKP
jgi:glutamate racemase